VKDAAHGRATTEQIDSILADPQLTLEKADHWLDGLTSHKHDEGPDLSALSAEGIWVRLFSVA
jgi:hypothetical protein